MSRHYEVAVQKSHHDTYTDDLISSHTEDPTAYSELNNYGSPENILQQSRHSESKTNNVNCDHTSVIIERS